MSATVWYVGRHRSTVEPAYDAPWPGHRFHFYVGKHRAEVAS